MAHAFHVRMDDAPTPQQQHDANHASQPGTRTITIFIVVALCLILLPYMAKSDPLLQYLILTCPGPTFCLQAITVPPVWSFSTLGKGKEEELEPSCTHPPLPLATGVPPFPGQVAGAKLQHIRDQRARWGWEGRKCSSVGGRKRFPMVEEGKREAASSPQLHIVLEANVILGRRTPGLNQSLPAREPSREASKRQLPSPQSQKFDRNPALSGLILTLDAERFQCCFPPLLK